MKAPTPKKAVKNLDRNQHTNPSENEQDLHRDHPVYVRVHPRPAKAKHRDRDTERGDRSWIQSYLWLRDDPSVGIEDGLQVDVDVVAKGHTGRPCPDEDAHKARWEINKDRETIDVRVDSRKARFSWSETVDLLEHEWE